MLRWIVELGRVDIDVEVSMMSSHLALPRVGHLKEIYIIAYLKADALELDLLCFLMGPQFIGVQRNRSPSKQAHLAVNLLQ